MHPVQGHRARKTEITVTQGGAEGTRNADELSRLEWLGVYRGLPGEVHLAGSDDNKSNSAWGGNSVTKSKSRRTETA